MRFAGHQRPILGSRGHGPRLRLSADMYPKVARAVTMAVGTAVLLLSSLLNARAQELDEPGAVESQSKALESAVAFSQSLSQWTVVIVGSSVAILLGTSYRRPKRPAMRLSFLLFLPSWCFLVRSLYMGVAAQRNLLAFLLLKNAEKPAIKTELNRHLYSQISSMYIGLAILGTWLLLYLLWWIFSRELNAQEQGGESQ